MLNDEANGNKATVRRFHDALNSRDMAKISKTIDEVVDPRATIRTPVPLDATGPQLLKGVFTTLLRSFPDLAVHIEDVIAENDKVVARNTVTGTHLGEYMGLPPTGKPVKYEEIFIVRLVDGRITQTWGVVDVLTVMKQIAALPPGAPSTATTEHAAPASLLPHQLASRLAHHSMPRSESLRKDAGRHRRP